MPLTDDEIEELLLHFDIQDGHFKIEPISDAVGFQGTYYRFNIVVDGRVDKYFVKCIPEGNETVNEFYRNSRLFVKEIYVYATLFPQIKKFISGDLWPHFYYGKSGRFMVLEDMANSGWKMSSCLDLNHMEVLLEGLAEFHVSSLNLIQEDLHSTVMDDTMFPHDQNLPGRKMWLSFCILAREIIHRYAPELDSNILFESLERVPEIIKPSQIYRNCLNHGDLWKNNLFFKYDKSKQPIKASFVDFQSARVAPPALDVSICLNIFYPNETDNLAKFYYKHLVKYMSKNNIKIISEDEFNKSFQYYKGPGLSVSSLYIFLTQLPSRYLGKIFVSQETFIPFALGEDTTIALEALEGDYIYRQAVVDSLRRIIHHYSQQ